MFCDVVGDFMTEWTPERDGNRLTWIRTEDEETKVPDVMKTEIALNLASPIRRLRGKEAREGTEERNETELH